MLNISFLLVRLRRTLDSPMLSYRISKYFNARAFINIQKEFGTFDAYVWQFVQGKPKINRPASLHEVPKKTSESDALSKDLKKRGMSFVGSTIMYAYMQAVGMVDDHIQGCFRRTK